MGEIDEGGAGAGAGANAGAGAGAGSDAGADAGAGAGAVRRQLPALTLNLPPLDPVSFDKPGGTCGTGGGGGADSGATTAPVSNAERVRFFSFSTVNASKREGGVVGGRQVTIAGHGGGVHERPRYIRQNTVSGGDGAAAAAALSSLQHRECSQMLSRAISRTYTMTSNASSSIPVEEWRPIFDKLDLESDGKADGQIPVDKFREILEDDPIWVETVPREVQDRIMDQVDQNKDGFIDYEEFIDLVRGRNIGFSRRKRRAMRELLKQTVEFIVPYKYSYQNQYSCSPPPIFMLGVSLLQVFIFAYNSAVMYREIGYIGLNGPVPYCSHLIYNPNRRRQVWRYVTYMFIHSGLFHATFNILIQLVLGIPLEMVHGEQLLAPGNYK